MLPARVALNSTYERGKPSSFSATIAGSFWQFVLPHLVRGDIREVYIPYALGFGGNDDPSKRPEQVGPNMALIFKVELVSIPGKDEAPASESGSASRTGGEL